MGPTFFIGMVSEPPLFTPVRVLSHISHGAKRHPQFLIKTWSDRPGFWGANNATQLENRSVGMTEPKIDECRSASQAKKAVDVEFARYLGNL